MAKKKPTPKVIHASTLQRADSSPTKVDTKKPTKKSKVTKKAVKNTDSQEASVNDQDKNTKSISIKLSKKSLFIALIVFAIAAVGLFAFSEYRQSERLANNPDLAKEEEATNVRKEVSKHAIFPEVEDATVATVKDISTFKNQPFFKEAKVGDKVLVYAKSRRVVLYRPSIDRIVNMTELSVTSDTEAKKQ